MVATRTTDPDLPSRLEGDAVLVAIFRAAPVGVGMVVDRVLQEVNERLCAMLGWDRADLVGRSARMLYPTDQEFELVGRSKYEQIRRHGIGTVETRWCRRDGSLVDVLLSSAPLDPADLGRGVIFTAIDISERVRAERAERASREALRDSEQRYRGLVESSSDWIWEVDHEGRYTFVGGRVRDILGYEPSEVLGRTPFDFMPPAEAERVGQIFGECIAEGRRIHQVQHVTLARDGREVVLETSGEPLFDANGRLRGYQGVDRDVTERRRAEEELRASELRFRSLADNVPVGVFRALPAPGSHFDSVNPAMARMLGTTVEQLAVTPDRLWLAEPEERERLIELLDREEKIEQREVRLRRADGTEFWASVSARLLRDDRGRMVAVDGTLTDVTEAREAAERLATSVRQLEETLEGTIRAMAAMVERRDPFTSGHQRRVARIAAAIAAKMGLQEQQIAAIRVAAEIHDVGKVGIPAEILSRPGALSPIERTLIETHPQAGYEILSSIGFPWPVAEIVLQHHEKVDGSGYPAGLAGDAIRIEARVLAVADYVEALASHRPYRPAFGIVRALEMAEAGADTQLDPAVVAVCRELFERGEVALDE